MDLVVLQYAEHHAVFFSQKRLDWVGPIFGRCVSAVAYVLSSLVVILRPKVFKHHGRV